MRMQIVPKFNLGTDLVARLVICINIDNPMHFQRLQYVSDITPPFVLFYRKTLYSHILVILPSHKAENWAKIFVHVFYQLWLCNRTIAAMIVMELMVMISKPRMYLCCLHSIVLKAQNCHIWWKSPLNDIVNTRGHWSLNYSYSLHITLLTTRGGQYWS